MSEIAEGNIWWWIRFFPSNIIKYFHSQLLHAETKGVNYVVRSGNPDGSIFFDILKVTKDSIYDFLQSLSIYPNHPYPLWLFCQHNKLASNRKIWWISKNQIKDSFGE